MIASGSRTIFGIALGFLLVSVPSFGERSNCPPKILVAFFSETGKTAQMAAAVGLGARTVEGVEVEVLAVHEVDREHLLAAQAVIVGSPVKNAAIAPEVQHFINGWPFRGGAMRDKIGAAFVTGGGFSAGEETVQLGLLRSMLVFGMVVAGGPDWRSAFGASAITEEGPYDREQPTIDQLFRTKGEGLGRRIAELVSRDRGCRADRAGSNPKAGG